MLLVASGKNLTLATETKRPLRVESRPCLRQTERLTPEDHDGNARAPVLYRSLERDRATRRPALRQRRRADEHRRAFRPTFRPDPAGHPSRETATWAAHVLSARRERGGRVRLRHRR